MARMLRKTAFVGLALLLVACVPKINLVFPEQAITLAKQHGVAILVYYYMDEEEYTKRYSELTARPQPKLHYLEQMAFLGTPSHARNVYPEGPYVVAYLGAGGIIANEHVLTVSHLFNHDDNTKGRRIWVIQQDALLPIEANLVAISEHKENYDDYAVLKLTAPLFLPGLKLARAEVADGERVIFVGTTGGLAFHTRFSTASTSSRYFRTDSFNQLHLSWWQDFEYLMVYPGGPGDSGGIVLNDRGELVGIMYCGLEVYAECYVFSNPLSMAWEFLRDNELEGLGQ